MVKTKIIEAPIVGPEPLKYPRLKRHKGSPHLVFLFVSETKGTGLTQPYTAGALMDGLTPGLYEDFPGTIELSNGP